MHLQQMLPGAGFRERLVTMPPGGCAGSPGYRQGVPQQDAFLGEAHAFTTLLFHLCPLLPRWLPYRCFVCVSPTSLVCWLSLLPAGRTLQLSASRGRHSQEGEGTCPVPAASLPGQAHHQHQLRGSGLAPVLPMRTHLESPLGTESSPPPPPPWCSHCLGLSEGTNHPGRLLPTAESLWSVGRTALGARPAQPPCPVTCLVKVTSPWGQVATCWSRMGAAFPAACHLWVT